MPQRLSAQIRKMYADVKPSLIDLEENNDSTGRKPLPRQRERLSERDHMYCVYWIKRNTHSDVRLEGYVGITQNLKQRISAHYKNKKKTPLTDAIKSAGKDALRVEVIANNLSLSEALKVEKCYRPGPSIGWNLQKGGELGVDASWYENADNSAKHRKATSAATINGIARKDSKEARSNRAKVVWSRLSKEERSLRQRGSRNGKARLNELSVRTIRYDLIPSGMADKEIAQLYNVKPYVIQFVRKHKTWKHV